MPSRRWARAAAGTTARRGCTPSCSAPVARPMRRPRRQCRPTGERRRSVQTETQPAVATLAPRLARPSEAPGWRGRMKALATRVVPARVLVKRGAPGAPRVALTFDDGPHEMTDAYLDVLDRFGARATFFVVGRECERYPAALLRIVARGHEVAGHGFTHTAFPSLSADALREELSRTAGPLPP